jgi:hypothetical protein
MKKTTVFLILVTILIASYIASIFNLGNICKVECSNELESCEKFCAEDIDTEDCIMDCKINFDTCRSDCVDQGSL